MVFFKWKNIKNIFECKKETHHVEEMQSVREVESKPKTLKPVPVDVDSHCFERRLNTLIRKLNLILVLNNVYLQHLLRKELRRGLFSEKTRGEMLELTREQYLEQMRCITTVINIFNHSVKIENVKEWLGYYDEENYVTMGYELQGTLPKWVTVGECKLYAEILKGIHNALTNTAEVLPNDVNDNDPLVVRQMDRQKLIGWVLDIGYLEAAIKTLEEMAEGKEVVDVCSYPDSKCFTAFTQLDELHRMMIVALYRNGFTRIDKKSKKFEKELIEACKVRNEIREDDAFGIYSSPHYIYPNIREILKPYLINEKPIHPSN